MVNIAIDNYYTNIEFFGNWGWIQFLKAIIPYTFDCTTVSEIPKIECEALVALYNDADGPNWADIPIFYWTDDRDWLSTKTPCSWYGVACETSHVTGLHFMENDLINTIPAEIGDLANLTTLKLRYTQLSTLPPQIGDLDNLTTLDLSGNQLSTLPPQIGDLDNLTTLELRYTQLSTPASSNR